MTDIEAKALALVNEACKSDFKDLGATYRNNILDALLLAIEREAATEARHAAELRELKERFSEATSLTLRMLTPYPLARDEAEDILTPFILPKPDPLVEALREAYDAAVSVLGEDYVRKLSWFPSARKIVWGGAE